jgi:hypothetical protein
MAFRTKAGYSWIGVAEKDKLAREAAEGDSPKLARHAKALAALDQLLQQREITPTPPLRCSNTYSK